MQEGELKLNATQAAAVCGFKSVWAIYRRVHLNDIPFHRWPSNRNPKGSGLYFYRSELEKWLDQGEKRHATR